MYKAGTCPVMHHSGVLLVAAELFTSVHSSVDALMCLGWNACRLSNDFREATRVVSQALPSSIPAGHVLLRLAFAGINASDVNFSAGRYHATTEQAQASLPFDAGFEAVGAVAAVGPQVSGTSGPLAETRLSFASFTVDASSMQGIIVDQDVSLW